jgi:hypothetical protein
MDNHGYPFGFWISMDIFSISGKHSSKIKYKIWVFIEFYKFFMKFASNVITYYFIAILQWSIGHQSSASIGGDFWLELVVRQMIFSRIPPKQCASRWLWGVHVIFFLAGSILIHCGKFRFDFFVECILSNHIFFGLSLPLFLTIQFFPTALRWILFAATKSQGLWLGLTAMLMCLSGGPKTSGHHRHASQFLLLDLM